MSARAFNAIVLAAGRSTRMGRDKASLAGGSGAPLWERQRDLLARAGAREIFLSARADQGWARSAAGFSAVVEDAEPDCGPLAGIVAGLRRSNGSHLAVLAVDLPAMEAAWFERLESDCATGIGAVGRRENFFEPLAAIYPRELLPNVEAALAKKGLSLQTLLAQAVRDDLMRERMISAEEMRWFENWNEPRVSGSR